MIFPKLPPEQLREFYSRYCSSEKIKYPKYIKEIISRINNLMLVANITDIDLIDNVIRLRKPWYQVSDISDNTKILPICFKHDKQLLKEDGFEIIKQGTGCGYRKQGNPMGYVISIKIRKD